MPDRPPRIPREEPDSDPPDYEERPRARPTFVTRNEMERYVNQLFAPVMAGINELRAEAVAARRERELRAQWDAEQRDKEQLDVMRARTKSESDLTAALQRPLTPLMFPAPPAPPQHIELPHAIDGELRRKQIYWGVATAIIVALIGLAGAAISSQQHPQGHDAPHVDLGEHH